MIGRDSSLARLAGAVRAAVDGTPQLVVVDAPAGYGRSTLLAAAEDAAHRAGCAVAAVRAAPGDALTPLAVASAVEHAIGVVAGGDEESSASRGPIDAPALLVTVDDAHLTDAASLHAVLGAVRQLQGRPVVLVLTVAAGQASAEVAAVLDTVRAQPQTLLIALGSLGDEDAAALVAGRVADAPAEFVAGCVARAGGVPALLAALAEEHHPEAGGLGPVPARVRASVAAQLDRFGVDARALALAVHVLGDGTLLRYAATLAGLGIGRASVAADLLVRGGLFRDSARPAFAAPLLGEAVGAGITAVARAELHGRAAALLRDEARPSVEVAAQVLRATPAAESWRVDALVALAHQQVALGRLAEAAQTLTRALEEPPDPTQLVTVTAELAVLESRLGAAGAEQRLALAVAAAPTVDGRVRILREVARLQWLEGRMAEAWQAGDRALAEAEPGTPAHDDAATELMAIGISQDPRTITAHPTLAGLVERVRDGWVPDSPGLAVATAFVLPLVLADHALVPRLVDTALDDELWGLTTSPFGLRANFALTTLHWADELELAAAVLARGQDVADDDLARRSGMGHWQTESHYAVGRLTDACAVGEHVLATSTQESPWWVPFTAATVAHAHLDRGDLHAADAALLLAERTFAREHLSGLGARVARARWHLHSGNPAAALAEADAVAADADRIGHLDGPAVAWRPVAAVAAHALGDAERAVGLAQEELGLARRASARARLGWALFLRARVETGDDALDLLEEAHAAQATTGRAVELARIGVALGEERLRRGDIPGARQAAGEAREIAEACGAVPLASAALACLHASGARPRRTARTGPGALTASERRIAELAALGRTNREIADELVLAPRTVEWHLGRAFTKLGVTSRRDLGGILPSGGP